VSLIGDEHCRQPYHRTQSGTEADFIWTRGKHSVGIEVKASPKWRLEHGRGLRVLHEQKILTACYAVYSRDTPQQDGPVRVLPLHAFLQELSAGGILAPMRERVRQPR
jgi:predicted AAA+ superfamily ATPase